MLLQFLEGIADEHGRTVVLRGVNVDGMAKLPMGFTTFSSDSDFWDGDNVNFVGRPFAISEAEMHFKRIKAWGFNTVRYLFTWEAIEHAGPKKYDEEFIAFTVEVLKVATSLGLYVFLDPHQDVWGRFSGGSGAPLWTYYACGMDPQNFGATRAAIVQNLEEDPHLLPKMLWPTNYYRLACLTIFALFFGGERLAPKCILDGQNIQHYLQQHFLNACLELYKAVESAGLFGQVFGIENVNEPNMGLIGFGDISKVPKNQNLRLGSTPTAFQSMLLGCGHAQKVDTYLFGSLGPKYNGKAKFDPKGKSAWLQTTEFDKKYGWKRGAEWQLGRCVWALHGVWDDKKNTLLQPHYFGDGLKRNEVNEKFAVDEYFVPYWRHHFTTLRASLPAKIWLLCQPPCLFPPPHLKGTPLMDNYVIYAPHFYDGLTLMLKRWSTLWNVDSLGFLRGRYKLPLFAIRVGESGIRSGIANQLKIMVDEGRHSLGEHVPCLMSETGVPMDMNHKESYENNNYTAQIKALDATASALEANLMHFTYWCYSTQNSYALGDNWNQEDFSFLGQDGPRAEAAYIRPGPIAINGKVLTSQFDLGRQHYKLHIDATEPAGKDALPTEIFIPSVHFSTMHVHVSSGTWRIKDEVLYWTHGSGRQTIKVSRPCGMCNMQ